MGMKVFISYAREDEALASRLVTSLEEAGLDAWYTKREILPGDNWAEKIGQGLKESNAMIVLLSADALKSDSVRGSISFALGEKAFNKRLIVVLVEAPPAKFLPADEVPWILNRLQTFKLPAKNKEEEQFKQIAQALKDAA